MRKINPKPQNTRKWKLWRSACEKAKQALLASVGQGKKPEFNERLYKRKSIKTEYFFSKGPPFYGKCAYCDSYIPDFQRGDVEHFRPKGGVTDENDNPVLVPDANGVLAAHPGYYWLAYDWRNLLPSCTICNQPTTVGEQKIGKHNRFPVIGQHARTSEEVEHEQPLLINPASGDPEDDPERHLAIDIDTGLLIGLTERGKTCIEVFGLNIRDQLVDGRRSRCSAARDLLIKVIYKSAQSEEAKKELIAMRSGERSYTMAARAVLAGLRPFLAPELSSGED
jgi:hypothetical protein